MKIINKTKQSFIVKHKDKVYGCSFKRKNKSPWFVGWISVYTKSSWENLGMQHEDIRVEPLTTEVKTSRKMLIKAVKQHIKNGSVDVSKLR